VRKLLQKAGVRIFSYVDTGYGQRDQAVVKAEVNDHLSQDVDGIFFDQVYNFLDSRHTAYYQELYEWVKSRSKQVIVNPGIAQPGKAVMSVTDILMVEHAWKELYRTNPWFRRYPPERFMGNSSNEHPDLQPGYLINCETAVRDTQEAWANGIGWHFSTDRYITLPAWFPEYSAKLGYGNPGVTG
jgi:hypothetical protein